MGADVETEATQVEVFLPEVKTKEGLKDLKHQTPLLRIPILLVSDRLQLAGGHHPCVSPWLRSADCSDVLGLLSKANSALPLVAMAARVC